MASGASLGAVSDKSVGAGSGTTVGSTGSLAATVGTATVVALLPLHPHKASAIITPPAAYVAKTFATPSSFPFVLPDNLAHSLSISRIEPFVGPRLGVG